MPSSAAPRENPLTGAGISRFIIAGTINGDTGVTEDSHA